MGIGLVRTREFDCLTWRMHLFKYRQLSAATFAAQQANRRCALTAKADLVLAPLRWGTVFLFSVLLQVSCVVIEISHRIYVYVW